MSDKRYWYHNSGANACGGKAFECIRKDGGPFATDVIKSHDFIELDGSKIDPLEEIVCGSCGKMITDPKVEDIK
jgi:hypothetical protein